MTRPINLITDQVGKIAAGDGDLTQQVVWENRGVLGGLADSINLMIRALRGSIAEIGKIAGALSINAEQMASVVQQMNASSQEVSSTVSHIAKGSEDQARRVLETSHAMENMSGTVQEIAGKAELSNAASMEAIEIASRGVEAALETANAIEAINSAAQVVMDTSEGLEARFMQISIIVDVITSVADQTNLLALNAAIEAARGESTAAVSRWWRTEVRKLAEDSRQAAVQISHLIGEIQGEVTRMTDNINRSVKEVAKGTEVVERTGTAPARDHHLHPADLAICRRDSGYYPHPGGKQRRGTQGHNRDRQYRRRGGGFLRKNPPRRCRSRRPACRRSPRPHRNWRRWRTG